MSKNRKRTPPDRRQTEKSDKKKKLSQSPASGGRTFTAAYLISATLTAVIGFLIYLQGLQNGFVKWDDPRYVYDNPHIRSLDVPFFKWALFDFYASNWHPLTWLSHAFDYALWGLNPTGHHLTSIVFHSLNTFLVTLLSIQLLRAYKGGAPVTSGPASLSRKAIVAAGIVAGLLFAVHPIHVESVAWVSERKDVLCAFFYLLSIMAYIQYASSFSLKTSITESTPGFSKRTYLVSLLFFVLALMSKPMAVVLPVVLIIIDWFPLKRFHRRFMKALLFEKLPFFVLAGASSVITLLAQHHGGAVRLLADYPLSARVMVALNAVGVYVWHLLWPAHLSPFYPYPNVASFSSYEYLLPLFLGLGVTLVTIIFSRKQRIWLAVWAYFLLTLLPVLGIVQVGDQSMADRYTYLPGLSLFLLAGVGVAFLIEKLSVSAAPAVKILWVGFIVSSTVILVSLSYVTAKQVRVWNNTLSLWQRVTEIVSLKDDTYYQNSCLAYFNLGSVYFDGNRLEDAKKETETALRLNPDYAEAHYNLGNIYSRQDRLEDAIKEFQTALRLNPDYVEAYANLGVVYIHLKRLEEAARVFQQALTLKPSYALAHVNLGIVYRKQDRLDDAVSEFRASLRMRPDFAEAHYELGLVYKSQNMLNEAVHEFETALKLRPDFAKARDNLLLLRRSMQKGKID